jgi:hypothetical protein
VLPNAPFDDTEYAAKLFCTLSLKHLRRGGGGGGWVELNCITLHPVQ